MVLSRTDRPSSIHQPNRLLFTRMKSPPILMPPPVSMLVLLLVSTLLKSIAPVPSLSIPFHGLIATLLMLAGVGFAAAIIFFLLINFRLIPFEEQLLKEYFGAEYETYCQRVRRWL